MDYLGFPIKVDERTEAERMKAMSEAARVGVSASLIWFHSHDGTVTLQENVPPLAEWMKPPEEQKT